MICKRGPALLEEHEQTYSQIDEPDERHVEPALKVLIAGDDFETYIINRLIYTVDALEDRIVVLYGVESIIAHALLFDVSIESLSLVYPLIFAAIKDEANGRTARH